MLINPTGIPKTGGEVSGLLTLLVGLMNTGALNHTGITNLAPTALVLANGSNNNVALAANATFVRYSGPTGAHTITGIAGGADGRLIVLWSTVNQALTLANLSGSSTAGNQIVTSTAADLVVGNAALVILVYDALAASGNGAWRIAAARGATGAV